MFKLNKIFVNFVFILCISFMGIVSAKAAYTVDVISTGGRVQNIGNYSDYNSAKTAMNNYKSTTENVAVVKENGEIIDASYALIKFKFDSSNPTAEDGRNQHRLFANVSDKYEFTTVHAAYGTDAAFLDYNNTYRRAKVKISGYTGWVNRGYYEIIPISRIQDGDLWIAIKDNTWGVESSKNILTITSNTPITIRKGHSTSSEKYGETTKGYTYQFFDKYNDGVYTWYRINGYNTKTYYVNYTNGNLLHYFGTHNSQGMTNLGKAPSFLKQYTTYFSYDGNYYYMDLKDMLFDYKNGGSSNAVNSGNPYYPYYLYLPNHTKTKYTANDFDQIIKNLGYTSKDQSAMYGEGNNFILSQEKYGVNALLTFSAAMNESAAGTSAIALKKNNLFGHNAYGNDPFANATYYNTVAEGIMAHAKMTGNGYNNPNDSRYFGGHYGNKGSGMNIKYATDPYWGEKMAMNAYIKDNGFGGQDFNGNTIGIKKDSSSVPIKKTPSSNSPTIHILNNNSYNIPNMPVVVFDRVYNEGRYWYKVYTDAALNENQDMAQIDYDFNKSYGYIDEQFLKVDNHQPIIIASDRTINKGENIDLKLGVIATDDENGVITDSIKISGTVYKNIPGDYKITYTATDNQQYSVSKTITVTVKGEVVPEIYAEDRKLIQYKEYDEKEGVTAKDAVDGIITTRVKVKENTVDIKTPGTYKIVYEVTNNAGKTATKEIKVEVIKNEKPTIDVSDKEIPLNSNFNPLEGVTASDKEDGKLKVELVNNEVKTDKEGTYKVTYKAVDNDKQETTKTINVKVIKNALKEKNGRFYLSYLKEDNGKLIIKGYNTIDGIDNNLNSKIKYELILKDENTGKEYKLELNRLTNDKEMDMPIPSDDGKDYKYSWFKDEIDFSNIGNGDYKVYVKSSTDTYYSESTVQNILFNDQEVQYNKDGKYVTILNDYLNNDIPMVFIVRDKKIADKESDFANMQYTYINKVELKENVLNINFAAYSVGLDMRTNSNIKRKVILENITTYERKTYDLEVKSDGPFDPQLLQADKFGITKDKSWSTLKININDIPKGNYKIYIINDSNITDYGEMNDLLFTDLNGASGKVGNKNVSLYMNELLRDRIELHIS